MAALTLAAIISLIVAVRAAPLPIAGIAAFWVSASAIARIFTAKRRRQHGRFIVAFEHELLTYESMSRARFGYALGAGSSIRVASSIDAQAPFWLRSFEQETAPFSASRKGPQTSCEKCCKCFAVTTST